MKYQTSFAILCAVASTIACGDSTVPTDLVNIRLRDLSDPALLCEALSEEFLQPAADCCETWDACDPDRDVWGERDGIPNNFERCLQNIAPNVDRRYYPPECDTTVGEALRVRTVGLPIFCDEDLRSSSIEDRREWTEENVIPVADQANADVCNPFGAALSARRQAIEEGAAP